jgi:predicted aminopeptidase
MRIWALGAFTMSFCTGCQLGYYLHSAYNQSKLINNRESIERALRRQDLSADQISKLHLVREVKAYAESVLGLKRSNNYTTFVQLDSPYVTYIVQAAYEFELKPYLWKFPFVGEVPYKGYFRRELAQEEADSLAKEHYDTYVRGVSAYSTLGWFQDSVLSSMLRYDDYELAEIIIHETVHTTLYIKSAAEFNERMANFLGREGMKMFFRTKGDAGAKALAKAEDDSHDQKLFSAFLTDKIEALKAWYTSHKGELTSDLKKERLKKFQQEYVNDLKPKLKTNAYREFEKKDLNNALILAYQTYEYSLDDFQKLFDLCGHDFKRTMDYLMTLRNDSKPAQTLKDYVSKGRVSK